MTQYRLNGLRPDLKNNNMPFSVQVQFVLLLL